MKQESFSDMEYSCRKKKTKREEFLEIMDEIIPWDEWVGIIRPYYPTGERGRPPIEIEIMLRMYLLQCWFNLSDEGVEDAIYDSYAMRKFMGINFFEQDVPDATTLLHFRHLLEEHGIGKLFFDAINHCLERAGRMMRGGSIVDATLISAPSSTKNAEKKRDPEMHQTKKGNQWHFGMKCHTGVDAGSGFVHTVEATSANVHDVTVAAKLLREDDEVVYGDRCGRPAVEYGWKNGMKSNMTLSFPPSNTESTAVQVGCPRFPTTPLTGSDTLKTANPLYVVRWSIPTEL